MARRKETERDDFKLIIPLDASRIEDLKPGQAVKVVAKDRKGSRRSRVVKLNAKGQGAATFTFPENPGLLRVYVGPADASDEELEGLQTISVDVSARLWGRKRQLRLHPIVIPPYYWFWWLRWCRTFTIRGVVRCPDGSPVPGARVCAFDVDWWWWWSSRQLVGCDTTDATGAFKITFRWCCGWWPWWWWRRRFWQLEPYLVDRIQPVLQLDSRLPHIADPATQPSLAFFERLLSEDGEPVRLPKATLDPAELPGLRGRLLERLPRVPELERLKIWPWWPWRPWWDCNPDIIFKVTQNCQGQEQVIVSENVWDTRWNIPTTLDVLLVANENACCAGQTDDPEGDCLVIDSACDDLVANIGGNPPGAPGVAATDGFRNPGGGTTWSDRPYAGVIPISGRFGDGADVDYYEFEWSDDDGATWNPMPTDAAGNFSRWYWGPRLGTADPPDWHSQAFNFNEMEDTSGDKHYVVESRQHFEANNEPASWGTTRLWWSQTLDRLMRWKTAGIFADGRYRLHVKSWELSGTEPGKLGTSEILPLCDTSDENGIVLYIDNRVETAGPTNAHGQACGGNTVHLCTTEPDTDIVSVKILHVDGTETEVAACGNVPIADTDKVQIDFVAYDPDGHLGLFTLFAHWGEDSRHNLLPLGTLASLAPSPVVWAPPATQVGPNYGDAQTQGAIPPIWHGGAIRLTIDNAIDAFPETCCYLLRLIARKRTIVNCDDDTWTHINRSERSFMIQV